MGIPLFFRFYRDNFKEQTKSVRRNVALPDIDVHIDNLLLDLNGPIHTAAQRAYKYGAYAKPPRMLGQVVKETLNHRKIQAKLFDEVCSQIEQLLNVVCPRKRLIICIDGPAPLAKQSQQRKRRYKSALEADERCDFDSNCITPGTDFMDRLGKYIDWFIRKRISQNEEWQDIEVVFSSDRAAGEGEHKALAYIRYYGNPEETYCINGCDADLIMLALGTHLPNMYILREDMYDDHNEYYCLDIGRSHDRLAEILRWESPEYTYRPQSAVNDFIFLCFMVGNDFLPHIPSVEIIEDGIELIIRVYKEVCGTYGHITHTAPSDVIILKRPLSIYLATIGHYEKEMLDGKLARKDYYFKDELLESCAEDISEESEQERLSVDITLYRKKYCEKAFPTDANIKDICHEYLRGMQWVLTYYLRGVPSWTWQYRYHYAPPAHLLAQHVESFTPLECGRTVPSTPFQQLLCVLPPKSAPLLPKPLDKLISSKTSPLKMYCPDEFTIDLSGKRKEWEGVVILPVVEFQDVVKACEEKLQEVDERDLARNSHTQSTVYNYDPDSPVCFCSKYGTINNCRVRTMCIDL